MTELRAPARPVSGMKLFEVVDYLSASLRPA